MTTNFFRLLAGAALLPALVASAETNQTATYRVADLNPGSTGSFPSNMAVFGGSLYFSAYTFATGRELWHYDGREITLATNINDTANDIGGGLFEGNDSAPAGLTPGFNALLFSAFDSRRGGELWRWDGSNAFRVADINPDANDTIKLNPNSSWPSELTLLNGKLYFSANSGSAKPNYELWQYDGASVALVTNIHPDAGSDFSSYPIGLTPWGGSVYFMADDSANGFELWKCDGTNAVLFNLNPGNSSSGSFPKYFTPLGGWLYFQAYQDSTAFELWRTDGTSASLVTNLNASGSSFPEFLTVFDNALYFRADDGLNGSELWKYDGAVATLVTNLNPSGGSFPRHFTIFKNELCFAANDGVNGWELWKLDGSVASLVTNLNASGDSFPGAFTLFNDVLYFTATTPGTGYEVWKYDGHVVTLVTDINPGPGHSFPQFLHAFQNQLVFSATEDGFSNWEVWSHSIAPLRIISAALSATNIEIAWSALGGTTNVVQVATEVAGPYSDIGQPMVIPGHGIVLTNSRLSIEPTSPARFYRVVQP